MAAKKKSNNHRKNSSGNSRSSQKKGTTAKRAPAKKTPAKKAPAKKSGKAAEQSSPLTREILFLAVLVFSVLALLSLFHMCGVFGEVLSDLLFGLLGAMAYIFPFYLVIGCGLYLSNSGNRSLRRRVLFSVGLYWCLCGLFQWVVNDDVSNVWEIYNVCLEGHGGGGFFGGLLAYELANALGRAGALIVILALMLVFFMLISGKLFFSSLRKLYEDREGSEEPEETVIYGDGVADTAGQQPMQVYKFETDDVSVTVEKPVKRENKKAKAEKKTKRRPRKTADLEEVVPSEQPAQDMSDINIIRGTEERESTVYKEELESKFGGKKAEPDSTYIENESRTGAEANNSTYVDNKKETTKVEKKSRKKPSEITKEDARELAQVQSELDKAAVKEIPYRFPSLDLLNRPKSGGKGMDNDELRGTAMKLQETLNSFGVRVKMGDISLGPSVTRYELIPEQGVKVSRITSLADDIKLSLAASDIRIEAPIPGKAAVGIEVPNPERKMITLRELLESSEFTRAKSRVTFAVGKDISGKTIVTDIAKMPHLLIAGATGSGKSVLINTLIMSIIYKADPNEVKMIMVDPKMVELTAYEDIPHLMIPVVKDPKKASAALGWAVAEMTNRYQKFADVGVRDIKTYNDRVSKATDKSDPEWQKMPQIVIIVDEFADLMMVAPGEVEDAVCRLAQLARAAGIHLVLATQRPSVNVITGLIKANIPSRIALSVSSAVDSRTIIDSAGAEKLLGNGDMLFAPQNLPKPIRVQGAFVSDEERDKVVEFLKSQGNGPSYNDEVTRHIDTAPVPGAKNGGGAAGGGPERDELFAEAGHFIIEKDKASIGLLQRMFRIGFNRAARIMDQLAEAGVVGPEEGTKARQILMSKEQFENYLEAGE